jgi:divinyl protochlorophyllide a 8-vinyl-reductase
MTVDTAPAAVAGAPVWLAGSAINGVAEVLPMQIGSRASQALFEAAGLLQAWRERPHDRVADAQWRQLQQVLQDSLGLPLARAVARDAGTHAADALLARHVAPWRRALWRRLPAAVALRLLARELPRWAWTFVGDAELQLHAGRPAVVTVRGNALCRGVRAAEPNCHYVCALLERLFTVLVHPHGQVVETACEAQGDAACRFELHWRRPRPGLAL